MLLLMHYFKAKQTRLTKGKTWWNSPLRSSHFESPYKLRHCSVIKQYNNGTVLPKNENSLIISLTQDYYKVICHLDAYMCVRKHLTFFYSF